MIRFGLAGAAIVAAALVTSLALAESGDRKHGEQTDRGPDFAATHTAFCQDRYARATGRLAFLETRLALTPQQQPLFSAWKDVILQTARTRANDCASEAPDKDRGMLAREARAEAWLQARLAALQAERPALTALYQSLSDEQKRAFDRAAHHHHGRGPGMWERHHEMRDDGDGPRGNMDDRAI